MSKLLIIQVIIFLILYSPLLVWIIYFLYKEYKEWQKRIKLKKTEIEKFKRNINIFLIIFVLLIICGFFILILESIE